MSDTGSAIVQLPRVVVERVHLEAGKPGLSPWRSIY